MSDESKSRGPGDQDYEIITYPNGTSSLKQVATGEVMHSRIGPWEEANLLYIQQSRLADRLSRSGRIEPLVLYDVGLGIGANAIGAIWCAEEARAPERSLEIHSFENDLKGMRFALDHPDQFPFLQGYESACEQLLNRKQWASPDGRVQWRLWEGDFFSHLDEVPEPELVFWDFYAPKSCPELWSAKSFEKLLKKTERRRNLGLATTLYTYSAATPIRVSMLLAGLYVGYGTSTAMKADTTVASTRREDLESPLDGKWLEKLTRSQSPFPYDWKEEDKDFDKLRAKILGLPQFSV